MVGRNPFAKLLDTCTGTLPQIEVLLPCMYLLEGHRPVTVKKESDWLKRRWKLSTIFKLLSVRDWSIINIGERNHIY